MVIGIKKEIYNAYPSNRIETFLAKYPFHCEMLKKWIDMIEIAICKTDKDKRIINRIESGLAKYFNENQKIINFIDNEKFTHLRNDEKEIEYNVEIPVEIAGVGKNIKITV